MPSSSSIFRFQWQEWLRLSRPESWLLLFTPFVIGALAAKPLSSLFVDWKFFWFGFFFLLPANLLLYGLFSLHHPDTSVDAIKTEEKKVTPEQQRLVQRVINAPALPFLLSSALLSPITFICFFLFVMSVIAASARPFHFLERTWLGLFGQLVFLLPGLFGFFLLGGTTINLLLVAAAWAWLGGRFLFLRTAQLTLLLLGPDGSLQIPLKIRLRLLVAGGLFAMVGLMGSASLGMNVSWFSIIAMGCCALVSFSKKPAIVLLAIRVFPWLHGLALLMTVFALAAH
jgi:hypothetical protein